MRRKSDKKIVLIDFGAVKEINVLTTANQPGTTTLTVAVGTPGYMPSEQAIGKPKLSSDIYAVGMVGIKALTGKNPGNLPTDPKTGNIIWRNQAQVSNRLANILDRMIHEYFSQRYENAKEVLEALGLTTSPQPTPAPTTQAKTVLAVPATQPQPTPTPIPVTKPAKTLLASPSTTNISIQKFKTVTVNARGEIISRRQHQAEVMRENLGNEVTLEMVKIPAGRFLMGSAKEFESPQHYVDVPEFFMGKYPVTQAQWQAVMRNNPSYLLFARVSDKILSRHTNLLFLQGGLHL